MRPVSLGPSEAWSRPDGGLGLWSARLNPLAGITVLDFGRYIAAPSAAQDLGSLGADVVKIESLPAGDPARRQPQPTAGAHAMGSAFMAYNAGKRSIAIDLRSPSAMGILERLVKRADVLIEGFRPGVMRAIGLDPDRSRALNPRLIYASLSGFSSEIDRRRAVDGVIQAESGIMSVNGWPDGPPTKVGFPVADLACGLMLSQAVLAALFARTKSGSGEYVQISLLDTAIYIQRGLLLEYITTGSEPSRLGNTAALAAPSDAFQTADGFIVVSAYLDRDWRTFAATIKREDLISDSRFSSGAVRIKHAVELRHEVESALRNESTEYWVQRFKSCDLMASAVHSYRDIVAQARTGPHHVLASCDAEHPAVRLPYRFGGDIPTSSAAVPHLGEHTQELLEELGFPAAVIQNLVENGIVSMPQQPR